MPAGASPVHFVFLVLSLVAARMEASVQNQWVTSYLDVSRQPASTFVALLASYLTPLFVSGFVGRWSLHRAYTQDCRRKGA